MKQLFLIILSLLPFIGTKAEDGSSLWLGREHTGHAKVLCQKNSLIILSTKNILSQGWENGDSIFLKFDKSQILGEGYHIVATKNNQGKYNTTIYANKDAGFLYGAYALLRLQDTGKLSESIDLVEKPAFQYRLLNHWDNLDGSIERGYAGKSIFWNTNVSKAKFNSRIVTYAKANASVGINGSVLNNVNASPKTLTSVYLDSVKQIAQILRPYGIKVYLSVNFGTPKALGATKTADPKDKTVIKWWKNKVKEIYKLIPDFGGFLVKASSEGQPGPNDYGRTHADGANMLADALKPFGGIVMWRSFVYGANHKGEDRVMQAVSEFKPLDGLFHENVILQSKNGPLDFQPCEPYAPIFDNIKQTPQFAEFQITQEYTGQSKHLVYLSPMWKEFFGFVNPEKLKGIAGVSNVGDDANYCGHPFSQANWYAFGRLAWNPELTSEQIAKEWLEQTFSKDSNFVNPMEKVMESSRKACMNYMMPLGLHHIFAFDHHYGPDPAGYKKEYPLEWCPVYYHKADSNGIGFDRTKATGSGATAQYPEPYAEQYENVNTCPEEYLLWFHHLPWNYTFKDGTTLWQQLNYHYNEGVDSVISYKMTWMQMKPYVDIDRWNHVNKLLDIQINNAFEWKFNCLNYFQTFSKQPFCSILN